MLVRHSAIKILVDGKICDQIVIANNAQKHYHYESM